MQGTKSIWIYYYALIEYICSIWLKQIYWINAKN